MKRTLRSAAKRLFINILLLLLPVMLILMGSFLRTNSAFYDREQFGDISLYGGGAGAHKPPVISFRRRADRQPRPGKRRQSD
jgi:hypothetical protein